MQAFVHVVSVPELEVEGELLPAQDQLVLTFTEGTLRCDIAIEDLNLDVFRRYESRAAWAIAHGASLR